ncbi:MAG: hypothetical protein HGB05_10390 [Chloroflexi bacterium]|nr:hypothetical protein [Chloroflexota bacterium]
MTSATQVHGKTLMFARSVWLGIALLDVGIFVVGLIIWLPLLQQACTEAALICQQQGQYTAAEFAAVTATGWSWQAFIWYQMLSQVTVKLVGVGVAFLIFWRKPTDRMAWVASLFLVVGLETSVFETLAAAQPAFWLITRILSFAGLACFGLFFYLFPTGQFVPKWSCWLAVAYGLMFFFIQFLPQSPLDVNQSGAAAGLIGGSFLMSFVLAQVYRYFRVSNAIERQQTKWVVFAVGVGVILFLGALLMVLARPDGSQRITQYWFLTSLGFAALSYFLPIAIGIAILRYRLFDIDVIIRKTLVYTVLTALLALIYFGGVVLVQQLTRSITASSDLAIAVSTLIIAALFFPLRRRVQNAIDRRFYRRKYDAAKTLAAFGVTVRDEVELEKLTAELLNVVNETMQPESISLWLKRTAEKPTRMLG